jgi:hypothetical protein
MAVLRPFPHPDSFCRQRLAGAVAQLGERLVRNEEVSGSIPLGSTNFRRKLPGKMKIRPDLR